MHQVKSKTRRRKLITIMFSSYKEKYQTSNTNVKRLISNSNLLFKQSRVRLKTQINDG
jgi:hypothetical protein